MRKSRTGREAGASCPPFTPTAKALPKRKRDTRVKTYVTIRNTTLGACEHVMALTVNVSPREFVQALRALVKKKGWQQGCGPRTQDLDQADAGGSWVDSLDQADAVTIPMQHLPSAGKGVRNA